MQDNSFVFLILSCLAKQLLVELFLFVLIREDPLSQVIAHLSILIVGDLLAFGVDRPCFLGLVVDLLTAKAEF